MQRMHEYGYRSLDLVPTRTMLEEAVEGLSAERKSLPCKYFYDARGSALFDAICELPEYYPTRTELGIMREFANEMVESLGLRCHLIEYGSGSSIKTRILLDRARQLRAYIPIDISRDHLYATAAYLRSRYPDLEIVPTCADYTEAFDLPIGNRDDNRNVVYFPGSTIGNFHPAEASSFLSSVANLCGKGGGLLIGVDLQKDLSVLESAYNDGAGVTAEFNRNILLRINAELGANFDLSRFKHTAFYNAQEGRIEMHLKSDGQQEVWIGNRMFNFASGETIWTENSYKYTLDGFASLAKSAGWHVETVWTDPKQWFSVQYLTVA